MSATKPKIGFLVYDGFMLQHVAGPLAALEAAGRYSEQVYQPSLISLSGSTVHCTAGVGVQTAPIDKVGELNALFVAGGFGVVAAQRSPALLAFIRLHAATGRRSVGVASGSFLMAAAGVLDGRRATTHWSLVSELAHRYPRVAAVRDEAIVQDGPFWTSSTAAAAVDLTRSMIESDFGAPAARRAAADLVKRHQRPTKATGTLHNPNSRFHDLVAWMRDHPRAPMTVKDLAEKTGLSERSFVTAFLQATATTPAKAVERIRTEVALELLAVPDVPILEIALLSGFGPPERMRRAFVRAFGKSPQAIRSALRERQQNYATPATPGLLEIEP